MFPKNGNGVMSWRGKTGRNQREQRGNEVVMVPMTTLD